VAKLRIATIYSQGCSSTSSGDAVDGLSDADEAHLNGPLRPQIERNGVDVCRNHAREDVADGDDAVGGGARLLVSITPRPLLGAHAPVPGP
jgi:hypothetical protein